MEVQDRAVCVTNVQGVRFEGSVVELCDAPCARSGTVARCPMESGGVISGVAVVTVGVGVEQLKGEDDTTMGSGVGNGGAIKEGLEETTVEQEGVVSVDTTVFCVIGFATQVGVGEVEQIDTVIGRGGVVGETEFKKDEQGGLPRCSVVCVGAPVDRAEVA